MLRILIAVVPGDDRDIERAGHELHSESSRESLAPQGAALEVELAYWFWKSLTKIHGNSFILAVTNQRPLFAFLDRIRNRSPAKTLQSSDFGHLMPIPVMQRVQLRKLQWDLIKTAVDLETKGLEVGSSRLDNHLVKYGRIKVGKHML